jgi:integrase
VLADDQGAVRGFEASLGRALARSEQAPIRNVAFCGKDAILALNPTEVKVLLSAARGDRLEAPYVLAIHTGLRRSEILWLKWTDVDLDAGTLSVQRFLETNGTFNPPKRNKSRRTVKLTGQVVEAIKGHRARQNEERLRLGSL